MELSALTGPVTANIRTPDTPALKQYVRLQCISLGVYFEMM